MRSLQQSELSHVSGGAGSSSGSFKDSDDSNKGCPSSGQRKRKGNNGFGNGGRDGVPGNSNKQDKTR